MLEQIRLPKYPLIAIGYLVLGLSIALTWYDPGNYFARGDNYPKIGASDVFLQQFHLWSEEHFGYFNPNSTVIYVWGFWAFVELLAGSSGGQVLFYGILLGGAMFFNHTLVMRLVRNRLAAIISSLFYIFNFFLVYSGLNMSVMFAFFLTPLILFLYANIISRMREGAKYTRETIIFALVSSLSIPIIYLNSGLLYVVLMTFFSFVGFFVITGSGIRKKIVTNLLVSALIVSPLLSWFVYVNYMYLTSENASYDFVRDEDWTWTHRRLTLENVLQLDGAWAFGKNYWAESFVDWYDSPVIMTMSYIPIALVSVTIATAIVLRSSHRAMLVLCGLAIGGIILFLVGSTGTIGKIVYSVLPFSFVLREPYTKLMLPLILFMSIVIGFSIRSILNWARLYPSDLGKSESRKKPPKPKSIRVIGLVLIVTLITSILSNGTPLLGKNRLESMLIPNYQEVLKIHVSPPDYWTEASNWINQQEGDWKVLFTPNDDYYLMPYDWGYYGVDFLPMYIKKQVIMQYYTYLTPQETLDSVGEIYEAVSNNDTSSFKLLLQLHNVKYIIQRNDILHEYSNRPILAPETVSSFLESQDSIVKVRQFGKLDVYEFKKPFSTASNVIKLEKTGIEYSFDASTEGWQIDSENLQHIELGKESVDGRSLLVQLVAEPQEWAKIGSAKIVPHQNSLYAWKLSLRAEDAHELQFKVAEYDRNGQLVNIKNLTAVSDSTFDWRELIMPYVADNPSLGLVQLQIWHGWHTNKPLPNKVWIDNVILYEKFDIYGVDSSDNVNELRQVKVDPAKYLVSFVAHNSSLLVLNQGYDPYWRANLKDEQVKSKRVYGLFNGFEINGSGPREIAIEFGPTETFNGMFYMSMFLSLAYVSIAIRPSALRRLAAGSKLFKNVLAKSWRLTVVGGIILIIVSYLVSSYLMIGSPVHQFKFNGDTQDSGKLEVDAINYGAIFSQGKSDLAISLNGIDNQVILNNTSVAQIDREITISMWIMSYVPKGNAHSILVTKGESPNPIQGYSLRFGYGNDLRFMVGDGEKSGGTDPILVEQFPAYVVATYDGRSANLYVNGELRSSKAIILNDIDSSAQLGIGGNSEAGGKYFEGIIDDVNIYAKALDPIQVRIFAP